MNTLPTTSGIYVIKCSANEKIYVGSTVNFRNRWQEHCRRLRAGRHKNPHLQNAWYQYGADAFEFTVLEECERAHLVEREQHYLDTLQPFKPRGFNIARGAYSVMLGRSPSPETRAKIGAANKGRKCSPEQRAKAIAWQKENPPSP